MTVLISSYIKYQFNDGEKINRSDTKTGEDWLFATMDRPRILQ